MSIQTMIQRIEQIEARLESLSPTRAAAPPSVQQPDRLADPARLPFPLLLGQALGKTTLVPTAAPTKAEMMQLADTYSRRNGLDPAVVRAVIAAESDWEPTATSPKGAKGLMQLMPEEVSSYRVTDPFDPEQNIAAGTRQLAEKLKVFGGDLTLALAAYNAGTANVRHYKGVPPFAETQAYIKRIYSALGR